MVIGHTFPIFFKFKGGKGTASFVGLTLALNWKLALAPLLFMLALFLAIPSLGESVGALVPVGIIVALIAARIMYKTGWI